MRPVPLARGEAAVALALLGLAAYAAWEAARMPGGTVALPGPGFAPLGLALLLAVTALALLGRALRRAPPDEAVPLGHPHVAVVLGGLAGLGLAFERLGFLLSMTLFLALLFRLLARRGWVAAGLAAVATTGLAWLFFARVLGVALPRGPF